MRFLIPKGNIKIFHKAIHSLAKIGDEIYFEPTSQGLSIKVFNSSKSAFAYFTFSTAFFTGITGELSNQQEEDPFRCKVMVRSLLLPFHSISLTDKTVDTCILDINQDKTKLGVTLHCRHKVKRVFQLPVLEPEPIQLTFPIQGQNTWQANPKMLGEVVGNFLSSQEEATMTVTPDRFRMKNYVDSYEDKEQVHTDFSMFPGEFLNYSVAEGTSLTFCLKEWRSLIGFADFAALPITANFDSGGQPIVFSINQEPFLKVLYVLSTLAGGNDTTCRKQGQTPRHNTTGKRSSASEKGDGSPAAVKRANITSQKENLEPPFTSTPCVQGLSPSHNDTTEHVHFNETLEDLLPKRLTTTSTIVEEQVDAGAACLLPATPPPSSPPATPASRLLKNKIFHRVFDATFRPQHRSHLQAESSREQHKILAQASDEEDN